MGFLGDAGKGVGAVPEDVLLDGGVADLLLAAVGRAGNQPEAAAHSVPLHLITKMVMMSMAMVMISESKVTDPGMYPGPTTMQPSVDTCPLSRNSQSSSST